MKYIIAYSLIIIMIFLTACEKEIPSSSNTTEITSEISVVSETTSYAKTEVIITEENTTIHSQSTEPIESTELDTTNNDDYFYPFAEDKWIRETVEEFRIRTQEFEEVLEKYNVSQSNGTLLYTTDVDEDVIIYRHPDNNYIFTGKSPGGGTIGYIIVSDGDLDMTADIYSDMYPNNNDMYNYDGVNFYYISTRKIWDIFAYGDYIYYIWMGDHGWFGGIERLSYVDGRWCYDEDFRQNNEIASMTYIGYDYSVVRKAYIDENETYIISSRYIYTFDGVELTPIVDTTLGTRAYSVYSSTKIGDIFYIGTEGYIFEINIVTGEEYIWTKSP